MSDKSVSNINLPQARNKLGNCSKCRFWSHENVNDMVIDAQGNLIPYEQMRKHAQAMLLEGKPLPLSQLPRSLTAMCWRLPQWQMVPDTHYCGMYEHFSMEEYVLTPKPQ